MTATAHALIAGAIATKFTDPLTSATLAFTSHFIMDAIPHWDVGTDWRSRPKPTTGALAIAETVLGVSLAYFFFGEKAPATILTVTIFFSLLPDWLETPWYIFFAHRKKRQPPKAASLGERVAFAIYRLENTFHAKIKFPGGILTQVLTVAFFLILLR